MSDHWGTSTPTMKTSNEGRSQLVLCRPCDVWFRRPKGSSQTHKQVDTEATCAPDAEATTNLDANRWKRN